MALPIEFEEFHALRYLSERDGAYPSSKTALNGRIAGRLFRKGWADRKKKVIFQGKYRYSITQAGRSRLEELRFGWEK